MKKNNVVGAGTTHGENTAMLCSLVERDEEKKQKIL